MVISEPVAIAPAKVSLPLSAPRLRPMSARLSLSDQYLKPLDFEGWARCLPDQSPLRLVQDRKAAKLSRKRLYEIAEAPRAGVRLLHSLIGSPRYFHLSSNKGVMVMYKHILISTDGSELATKGLLHGLALAKTLGAAVTIVTVTEMWSSLDMAAQARAGLPHVADDYEKHAAESARTILDAAMRIAQEQGMNAEPLHIADQHPADGIITACKSKGCDLIVMSSHGRRGISRLLLGSHAAEVLAHSTVPVLVVR